MPLFLNTPGKGMICMTLSEFFARHPRIALAFSGGVDSSYLLYAAIAAKAQVQAYYSHSAFQPRFELKDALALASQVDASVTVLEADVLSDSAIAANPADRCYYCKKKMFSALVERARADGYPVVADGTNASDDASGRPGMKALEELGVLSPLRLCGLTKDDIRRLSRNAGLFTWDKPSYSCLATRIPEGTPLTAQLLERTERAEDFLFSLGFSDFRVRTLGTAAKIELTEPQFALMLERRAQVESELKKYYSSVLLSLEARS